MAENATEKEVNMMIVLLSNTNSNNNNCKVALWVMFPADGLILTFWKPPYSEIILQHLHNIRLHTSI